MAKYWSDRLIKNPPKKKREAKVHIKAVSPEAKEAMGGVVARTEFWQGLLDEYLRTVLVKEMAREWKREEGRDENYPQLVQESLRGGDALDRAVAGSDYIDKLGSGREGSLDDDTGRRKDERGRSKSRQYNHLSFRPAFAELWSRIRDYEVRTISSERVSAGLADYNKLLAPELTLQRYMPTWGGGSKSQKYNTLWYAVEYGTGALAGADEGSKGLPEHIREDGDTKDPRPGYEGTWWLGPAAGQGTHFLGQAGFHFLHDARTREPREKWASFIQRTLPDFIDDYLAENAGRGYKRVS